VDKVCQQAEVGAQFPWLNAESLWRTALLGVRWGGLGCRIIMSKVMRIFQKGVALF
jgi:hypothetical protein